MTKGRIPSKMMQAFLDTIKSKKKGFMIINNKMAFFANDLADIHQINFKKSQDDFIFTLHEMDGLTVRSYPLDDSSPATLVIIGTIEHTSNERKLLKQLFYKTEIIPDYDLIQSIIPKRKNLENIVISEDLKDDLAEIVESDDAKKLGIIDASQIITAAAKEFLLNFYNKKRYKVQSKIKNITLEYTIMGRFVFCNLCSLQECEHIDLFFSEPEIREDVEKQGIRPIRYNIHDEGKNSPEKIISDMASLASKEKN